jgi:hypothetical protein
MGKTEKLCCQNVNKTSEKNKQIGFSTTCPWHISERLKNTKEDFC